VFLAIKLDYCLVPPTNDPDGWSERD
jgi:hypothetical protein